MARHALLAVGLALLCSHEASANPIAKRAVVNADTSLTLLYQNNLNISDDANHVGTILLDGATPGGPPEAACASLGEKLLPQATLEAHEADFARMLGYVSLAGRAAAEQAYVVEGGLAVSSAARNGSGPSVRMGTAARTGGDALPVLCTQSNNKYTPSNVTASEASKLAISAAGNTYVGFRDQKSFRFLGIRYAEPPKRWEYATTYSGTGQTLQATNYGPQCLQGGGGSEDCLFLNIQTPYLPRAGSTKDLRPVHFWIHGGGFTGGASSDPGADGGQLASREDIVQVSINYRLSTLGFLAVPGTNITGNYGIADQSLALDVRPSLNATG